MIQSAIRVVGQRWAVAGTTLGTVAVLTGLALAQDVPKAEQAPAKKPSSYAPVETQQDFKVVVDRMQSEKPAIQQRQMSLLKERYDLGNQPADGAVMSRGKAVQEGVRVRLYEGSTWAKLAAMSPAEIQKQNLFPPGFMPLPHPNHPEGGMLFPKFHIEEMKKQEGRDLTRFDLDYDLPDHFLPEFPPPLFLTSPEM